MKECETIERRILEGKFSLFWKKETRREWCMILIWEL